MKSKRLIKFGLLLLAMLIACNPANLLACTACFGQSDSPMARGMNWGILSLLVVIVSMLGSIGGFAFYLGKRAAAVAAGVKAQELPVPNEPSSV